MFSVTATGTTPLRYQWLFDGTNITGAVNSSLLLTNLQLGQSGSYSVVVTNVLGSATSSNAVLTVVPAAPCVTPPVGMVGWWRGEGNALDATGLNNGTAYNNLTYAPGVVGQAFVLDGVS